MLFAISYQNDRCSKQMQIFLLRLRESHLKPIKTVNSKHKLAIAWRQANGFIVINLLVFTFLENVLFACNVMFVSHQPYKRILCHFIGDRQYIYRRERWKKKFKWRERLERPLVVCASHGVDQRSRLSRESRISRWIHCAGHLTLNCRLSKFQNLIMITIYLSSLSAVLIFPP